MFRHKYIHLVFIGIIVFAALYYSGKISSEGREPSPSSRINSPNSFGSTALPSKRSPYTAKWLHAAKNGSGPGWNRIVRFIASGKTETEKLANAQIAVNRSLLWGTDPALWGQEDFWASPNETLKKGAGDCEDFAILKMMALRAAGFPQNNLFMVVGLDTATRNAHAVLVAKIDRQFWVLDQRTDSVIPDQQFLSFTPVINGIFAKLGARIQTARRLVHPDRTGRPA